MSKELEQRIKQLEAENFNLKFESTAKNSKISDLEKIISGHLAGNPQQQNQQSIEKSIATFGSGLPQNIKDYIAGKTNTL